MLITDALVEKAMEPNYSQSQIDDYLNDAALTSMAKLNVIKKLFKANKVDFNQFPELKKILEIRHFSTHEFFQKIEQSKLRAHLKIMKAYYQAAHKIIY